MAGVFQVTTSGKGAADDIGQLGAGLVELGLLAAGATSTPVPFVAAAILEATRVIEMNFEFFDKLRRDLLALGRAESPTLAASWGPTDDDRFLATLKALS